MPVVVLTKRAVDAAQPERDPDGKPRRTLYFDQVLKGFGLLVTEAGTKSFVVKYRAGSGRAAPTRRVTIGRYGAPWTPEQARSEARRILAAVAQGGDPAAERAARRRGVDKAGTVAAVVEEWLRRDQADNRTVDEVRRIVTREVLPHIGGLPIAEVRKRDLIEVVDRVADRAPVRANRVLAYVKRLFRWAASRDLIELDPAAHILKRTAEKKRDRALSNAELLSVWEAAGRVGGAYGNGVRLLVATGARREEIFGLRWSEVDREAAVIRLPAERNKVKEPRSIPLSPLALSILDELPPLGEFALSAGGRRPFSGFGKCKARLDGLAGVTGWRVHDLRRTVATGLQRLGLRLEVIEAVLGHVSGSRAGIVGTYQRHRFEDETRAALVAWGEHVSSLLAGRGSGPAVPLRRTA